jgi:hypothetical protein
MFELISDQHCATLKTPGLTSKMFQNHAHHLGNGTIWCDTSINFLSQVILNRYIKKSNMHTIGQHHHQKIQLEANWQFDFLYTMTTVIHTSVKHSDPIE